MVSTLQRLQQQLSEGDVQVEHIYLGDRKLSVRTSVLEEKATACTMLCCYADELKEGFYPYVEQVFTLALAYNTIHHLHPGACWILMGWACMPAQRATHVTRCRMPDYCKDCQFQVTFPAAGYTHHASPAETVFPGRTSPVSVVVPFPHLMCAIQGISSSL